MAPTSKLVGRGSPKVLVDDIPADLKGLPQWVLWRWEQRGDKWTKPPYQANGQYADSTRLETWCSFSEALSAYQSGAFDGIGFVLTKETGIVGVDLDHCRDPATGAVEPWAAEIVTALGSYTEVTPSGAGLRIFVYGRLPPGGRKKGDVEMYDTARFLTVTGWRLEMAQ